MQPVDPETNVGRRVVDDRPVSLAQLIETFEAESRFARVSIEALGIDPHSAIEEASKAAEALNEALRLIGGRGASTTLHHKTYQHSLGGLRVFPAVSPAAKVPKV